MFVSIIIPVYNVAEYIERCLLSVFNQTYKNIEVILVDDKSPDDSVSIITSLMEKQGSDVNVKLIRHQQNGGLSASRNTGVANASGDYLYFLDSDDSLSDANAIQYLVNFVNSEKLPDVVIGNLAVFEDGVLVESSPFRVKKDSILTTNEDVFFSYIRQEWYTMAQNKLVNKDFFLRNKLFFCDGLLHEDFLWSFQLALKAEYVVLSTHDTYNYYMRSTGSITSAIKKKNGQDLVFIYNKILDTLVQDGRYNSNIFTFRYMENIKLYSVFLYTIKLNKEDWISNVKKINKIDSENITLPLKDRIKRILLSLPYGLLYNILSNRKKK